MIMSITLVWTIILVIAVIVEAITIDLVSIWFGIGAIAALICHFFGVGEVLQIVIFAIVSIVCIVASRPLAKKYLRGNTVKSKSCETYGQQQALIMQQFKLAIMLKLFQLKVHMLS